MADGTLDTIIDHPGYTIIDFLGQGSWGSVYRAKDNVRGGFVALKVLNPKATAREKMKHRQLTPFEVLQNEGDLAACSYVVPRTFEIDNRGTPFIRMPVYRSFLSDIISDSKEEVKRNFVGNWLNKDNAIAYLADIARGIAEMHAVRKRVHADIKQTILP